MTRPQSQLSIQALIALVQQDSDPTLADEAFAALFAERCRRIRARCRLKGLPYDDVEDAVVKVGLAMWKGLPRFNYRSDAAFESWVNLITQRVIADFYRDRAHFLEHVAYSLDDEVRLQDGRTVRRGELCPAPCTSVWQDWSFTKRVMEIAEQCLTPREYQLFRYDVQDVPLPADLTDGALYAARSRYKRKLRVALGPLLNE